MAPYESSAVWTPSDKQVSRAHLTSFRQHVSQKWLVDLPDYESLRVWSVKHSARFWQSFWEHCNVRSSRHWDEVLQDGHMMPGARWFVGARLNFAENLLRFTDDRRALVFWNERGFQSSISYAELSLQVAALTNTFREWGIKPGDRIAGYLPNIPQAVIGLLASASIGAIWSSCSPDFGVSGVLDRFGQIEPKVLIVADGYEYDGKTFDTLSRVPEILNGMPSVTRVLVVPYVHVTPEIDGLACATLWPDALHQGRGAAPQYEQLLFDHPLAILYSSGSTGRPKCLVHSAGGVLLQHLKEHVLHTDLKRDDRLFYFTTTGWMMWNWLVSGLAVGCEVVLYDGSPLSPRAEILFDMAERERITVFGTSPRFLSSAAKAGLSPRRSHNLVELRAILSTGAPLTTAGFDYVYEHLKADVQLASISGGTDICSCFVLGNPVAPVYRGEIQTAGLGMDVRVYNDSGQAAVGKTGELVCAAPFPSMPLGLWGDSDGSRYRATYFQRFPGVWHHGDFAEVTDHGGFVITGRSDAVLNPGGVRIGTAEIYRQVELIPEVLESVVIGQQWEGDVRIVLFVKLRSGEELDAALEKRIRAQIRSHASPRHVPAKILAVKDIPRTRSGKTVELAVRDAVHGRDIANTEALANPEALACFRDRPELQS